MMAMTTEPIVCREPSLSWSLENRMPAKSTRKLATSKTISSTLCFVFLKGFEPAVKSRDANSARIVKVA